MIETLVVDNNPVHLKAVSSILEAEQCTVVTASNGLEALEKIQQKIPDILFTDLVMPMVDGEKLCSIVRGVEEYKSIFVVLMSAIIEEDKERIVSEIDFDVCISKGTLAEMRGYLQEALRKYRERDEAESEVLGAKSTAKTIAKELLHEKEHLQLMFENLSEGIIELSHNGLIVSANDSALTIFNCVREEIYGKVLTVLGFNTFESKIKEWCRKEIHDNGGNGFEINEKEPLFINNKVILGSFLPIRKKRNSFGLCIFRDITRQYRAEKKKEEIDQAVKLIKKMEAMSFMAGGVAHDFNNLLTVICGNLDMISAEKGREAIMSTDMLDNAKHAAYSAVELVRKISHFSPFGIVKRKKVKLADVVQSCTSRFAHNYTEYKIVSTGDANGEYVYIDESQIEAAIDNVLKNAVEASNIDATITVIAEKKKIENQEVVAGQYVSPGDYLRISIADNGKGIRRENIHEVFDPYYSTKQRSSQKGMGLGLAIVYSTLRNHSGYVVMESTETVGTTVHLYLPEVKKEAVPASWSERHKRILVVENDNELSSICKMMLEYLHYVPEIASSKEEALAAMKRKQEEEKHFGMVLLNLSEGGKRSGVELCHDILALDNDVKVIVCSGLTFDPVMLQYKEYGFSASLGKPYTLEDLRVTLSKIAP